MAMAKELLNQQFGDLTVTQKLDSRKGHMHWLCRCKCGKIAEVSTGNLNSGHTKSCGCLQKKRSAEIKMVHGLYKDATGKRTKLYHVWGGMKERCFNQNHQAYKDYGRRGITVCEEWLEYAVFHDWAMKSGYKQGLSIERINNDGNYEPANCEWIPRLHQAANRRNVRMITHDDVTLTASEWGKRLNLNPKNILNRLRRGWSVEEALTNSIEKKGKT